MTRSEIFKQLLDKLADRAPTTIEFNGQKVPNEKKAFMCQVVTTTGTALAGACTKTSMEGLYVLRQPMRQGDPRTGKITIVDQFITTEDISSVILPVSEEGRSGLVGANGSEVIPVSSDV